MSKPRTRTTILTICQLRPPDSKQQLRAFLGMAGFCHIWITHFEIIAKPLDEATKGPATKALEWNPATQEDFQALK